MSVTRWVLNESDKPTWHATRKWRSTELGDHEAIALCGLVVISEELRIEPGQLGLPCFHCRRAVARAWVP